MKDSIIIPTPSVLHPINQEDGKTLKSSYMLCVILMYPRRNTKAVLLTPMQPAIGSTWTDILNLWDPSLSRTLS